MALAAEEEQAEDQCLVDGRDQVRQTARRRRRQIGSELEVQTWLGRQGTQWSGQVGATYPK